MQKVYKLVRALTFLMVLTPAISMAQHQEDIARFLNAGSEDASKLLNAYLEPTVTSLSYGMTGNWFTTAATHKPLGIDFSLSFNAAFIPSADDYFDPNKLNLSVTTFNGNVDNPGKNAPTFFGPKETTTYTATYDDGSGTVQTIDFNGPEGLDVKKNIGFACIPVPVAQIGIGIVKNTDLKFRFIPKVSAGQSELQMFGVGVQHDIKQHFKGIKLLPFDLSVLVAFNSLKGETDLRHESEGDDDPRPGSADGKGEYKFNSWVFQALISKKVAVLTFYGGIGYSFVNTDMDVNGTYVLQGDISDFEVTNPISMNVKNKSARFTAGMRLKLGPIYFNGDYTLQKYNTLTVGLGFTVR